MGRVSTVKRTRRVSAARYFSCWLWRRRRAEIDHRRFGDFRLVLDREIRLHVIAKDHRGEIGRELAHQHIEFLHGLDVAVACHGNAILGSFKLRLQIAEILVGLEVRVGLNSYQQP